MKIRGLFAMYPRMFLTCLLSALLLSSALVDAVTKVSAGSSAQQTVADTFAILLDKKATAEKPTGEVTTSRYVNWVTGDALADVAKSGDLGCAHASEKPGVVVLGLGGQREGGATAFSGKGVVRPYALLTEVVKAYVKGMERCGASAGWTVAVATTNQKNGDAILSASRGKEWGDFVRSVQIRDSNVAVIGGNDMEPAWGSVESAVAWRDAYEQTAHTPLLWVASADGCPRHNTNGACANGWSQAALASVLWSDGNGTVMPQIYTQNHTQALQWAQIAATAIELGITPRFAGALSQHRACDQVAPGSCNNLDLDGVQALAQLREAFDSIPATTKLHLPFASDIGWGE